MRNPFMRRSASECGMLMLAGLLCLSTVGSAQNPLGPFGPNSVAWPVAAGGNGHIYEAVAVSGSIGWPQASAAAVAAGGYLATVTSPSENAFVFSLINHPAFWVPNSNHGPWLGGQQKPGSAEPAGGWTWVTGE